MKKKKENLLLWFMRLEYWQIHLWILELLMKFVHIKYGIYFLFVWGFSSHSRIFQSYGDVTITGERLQILTYAWHLWPLSSKGFKAWHIYSDTAHPFMMVISEDPWTSHLLASVWQWSCHYLFLRLRLVLVGIRTPNPPLAGRTLKPTAQLPRRLKDNTFLEGLIIRYHFWFCSEVYC